MVLCYGLELIHRINNPSAYDAYVDLDFDEVVEVVTPKPCCLGETITEKMKPSAGFNLLKRTADNYTRFKADDFFEYFKRVPKLNELLSSISKNVEHWKLLNAQSVHQKVYFLLKSWLKGIIPPTRCQALINDTPCLEEAATKKNSPFCSLLHRCHANMCTKVIIIIIIGVIYNPVKSIKKKTFLLKILPLGKKNRSR